MKSSVILILLLCITLGYAQNDCPGKTSCATCTAEAGCGWCSATQQCIKGDKNGPSTPNDKCLGSAWLLQCPDCSRYTNCRDCSFHSNDCGWSNTDNQCRQLLLGTPRDECTCNEFPDCGECNYQKGCVWCPDSDECIQNAAVGQCNNPTDTCSCSAVFSCDRCQETEGCQWCAGGPEVDPVCAPNNGGCPNSGLVAHSCGTYCERAGPTCGECITAEGCTWCEKSSKCIDVSRSPAECGGLVTHQCKQCNEHLFCSSCTEQPGCSWCGEAKAPRCVESSTTNCGFLTHTCESFCSDQTDCGSCRALRGCGWCSDGSCVDIDTATCPLATQCPKGSSKCGFDAGSFVGGMFLIIGLVLLVVGGYMFYRWKTGMPLLPGTSWQRLE